MDSMDWLHIYPLCEIFYFRGIDNSVMLKLTGQIISGFFRQFFPLFISGKPVNFFRSIPLDFSI